MDHENVLPGGSTVPRDMGDHNTQVYHTGNQYKPCTQLDGLEILRSACQISLIDTDVD
jgi:hypothetical protein